MRVFRRAAAHPFHQVFWVGLFQASDAKALQATGASDAYVLQPDPHASPPLAPRLNLTLAVGALAGDGQKDLFHRYGMTRLSGLGSPETFHDFLPGLQPIEALEVPLLSLARSTEALGIDKQADCLLILEASQAAIALVDLKRDKKQGNFSSLLLFCPSSLGEVFMTREMLSAAVMAGYQVAEITNEDERLWVRLIYMGQTGPSDQDTDHDRLRRRAGRMLNSGRQQIEQPEGGEQPYLLQQQKELAMHKELQEARERRRILALDNIDLKVEVRKLREKLLGEGI